jgi:fatty-acyl-CoA synthase
VDTGEVGEIVVRGPITMLGYWERPDETAATLRGGWLRTGDLAVRDDEGFITLTGRARDMYISGGENVYPAEVESVLAEHPAIREVAVVGVPDPDWGEVGCVHAVLEEGSELGLEALCDWAAERLASFKLPRDLVLEESLPRTASGKVQKHELRSR